MIDALQARRLVDKHDKYDLNTLMKELEEEIIDSANKGHLSYMKVFSKSSYDSEKNREVFERLIRVLKSLGFQVNVYDHMSIYTRIEISW